jgi:glycosyltransferase involved in cell wall biosynthesis
MITNHGIHQWEIIPGLPDTGGQNVFVNQFTAALAQQGFKITIANRGGYRHPITGEWREGLHYKDDHQRILYLKDGRDEFVPKEQMNQQAPVLAKSLARVLHTEQTDVDLIISHYWDGAKIGVLYNQGRQEQVNHVWVPHSLGTIKKRNVSPDRWSGLRVDERIAVEKCLLQDVDGVAATSATIKRALEEDYAYASEPLFLPPCVDTARYHPRDVAVTDKVWRFLGRRAGIPPHKVRECKIITEISRTDSTKRKDVLIKAFAQVCRRYPDGLLVVSIDSNEKQLAEELNQLIHTLELQSRVAVVGNVWEWLPIIYAVTYIYCTPSIMEGFGMSAQESAATGVPVVASHLVPFATEYLAQAGGAIIVQADDVDGFAQALEMLFADEDKQKTMGRNAYRATVPYFTWTNRVRAFLAEIGGGREPTT